MNRLQMDESKKRKIFAYQMRIKGKTYREIGEVLGVGSQRALDLVRQGRRISVRDYVIMACDLLMAQGSIEEIALEFLRNTRHLRNK